MLLHIQKSSKRLPSSFEATEPRGGLCGKCRLPGHARCSMRCTHNIRQLNQDYVGETNAWLAANPTILPTQYRTKHGFTKWSESWRRQNKKSLPFQRVDLQSETLTNICSPHPMHLFPSPTAEPVCVLCKVCAKRIFRFNWTELDCWIRRLNKAGTPFAQ